MGVYKSRRVLAGNKVEIGKEGLGRAQRRKYHNRARFPLLSIRLQVGQREACTYVCVCMCVRMRVRFCLGGEKKKVEVEDEE
jgi:hypothetical protein